MATIGPAAHHLKDGRSIIVRHAVEADAGMLAEYGRAVMRDGAGMVRLPEEFSVTLEKQIEKIRAALEHDSAIWLVADHQGLVVGGLDFHPNDRCRRLVHGGSFGMGALPQWRGLGVGEALLRTLIAWAQRHAALEKISLAVRADNVAANGLYRKLGFIEEGRRVREIKLGPDHYVDDVLMYLWVA